jgi:hypothetical protein
VSHLGLVVRERHGEVAGEQEYLLASVAEPFEQVAGLGLFAPGPAGCCPSLILQTTPSLELPMGTGRLVGTVTAWSAR